MGMESHFLGFLLTFCIMITSAQSSSRNIIVGTLCTAAEEKHCMSCKSVGSCFEDPPSSGTFYLNLTETCGGSQLCDEPEGGEGACVSTAVTDCQPECTDGTASFTADPYSGTSTGGSYILCDEEGNLSYHTCQPYETPADDEEVNYCQPDSCPTDGDCPEYYLPGGEDGCCFYYYCGDSSGKFIETSCLGESKCFNDTLCECSVPYYACPECGYKPKPGGADNEYILCVGGLYIEETCPGDLIFDEDLCDCVVRPTDQTTTSSSQCTECPLYPDPDDCSIFYSCNLPDQPLDCLGGTCFHEAACNCIDCPPCGFKPDPDDPEHHRYIDCHTGTDVPPVDCSPEVYDEETCTCVEDTSGSSTPTSSPSTPQSSPSTTPGSSSPTSTGASSTPTVASTTPTGASSTPTVASTTPTGASSTPTGASTTPTGASSTPTGASSTPTGASSTTTVASSTPTSVPCPDCGSRPIDGATGCQNQYIYCGGGVDIIESCLNSDFCFNEEKCYCEQPVNCTCGAIPDASDPHNYFICSEGSSDLIPGTCGPLYFDPSDCTCVEDQPTTSTPMSTPSISSSSSTSSSTPSTSPSSSTPSSTLSTPTTSPSSSTPSSTLSTPTTPGTTVTTEFVADFCSIEGCNFYGNFDTTSCTDYYFVDCTDGYQPGEETEFDCPEPTCFVQSSCKCALV